MNISAPTPRGHPVRQPGDTVYVDDLIQLTKRQAWAWFGLPPVPYAFRSEADRLNLGWQTTLSLAALKTGRVHLKTVLEPVSPRGWAQARDAEAHRSGNPAPGWPGFLERQQKALLARHSVVKRVYLGTVLGNRRIGRGPLADTEVAKWRERAESRLSVLSKGSLQPYRLTTAQMMRLRRHPFLSGLAPTPPASLGRPFFGAGELVDEMADLHLTPLPKMVRVDTARGTRFHATFVLSMFPVEMDFPATDPWLAWADRLGFPVEYDLIGTLYPPKKVARDVRHRLNLARDQERDARQARTELPLEVEQMMRLARQLQYEIPTRRLPLFYGWARLRVSSEDPSALAAMFEDLQAHYAKLGGTGIDVSWPVGAAQEQLLYEAVPGSSVCYKSWKQRWMLETVACALPTASSGAGDEVGDYRGYTTGRYKQSIRIDPHYAIRALGSRNLPAGIALVGNSGAGKSAALQNFAYSAAMGGITQVIIDPSGPLTRLAGLPDLAGRVSVINLLEAGGGVADPLGGLLIPMPDDPDPRRRVAVQSARSKLCIEVFHGLTWRQLAQHPDAETEMLQAIREVSRLPDSSSAQVVQRLLRGNRAAKFIGAHLREILDDSSAEFLSGEGGTVAPLRQGVSAVFTLPGVSLPKPNTPMEQWTLAEQLGRVALTLTAWMGRRLLWELPSNTLKLFSTDESYILLDDAAGYRLMRSTLLDGRKNGCAVVVSVPNANMILRHPELADAFPTRCLFRVTSEDALTSSLRLGGLEDEPTVRRALKGFADGECLLIDPNDIRDRFRWHPGVHPDLDRIINTTPSGEAWAGAV